MNDPQLGALFRAVRIQRHLRQEDVGAKARVSQSTVSRIERGQIAALPINCVRAVAGVLEIRLDVVPSWRGGDLERLVNARHTALHEQLAERMASAPGWDSAAEVSFSIWGERGVIDRLAFHAERRVLAVFEIKADPGAPADLVSQLDRYRRLAPRIGLERGWEADHVCCWAVVADTDTNRRRLRAHQALLRGAISGGRGGVSTMAGGPDGDDPRAHVSRISACTDWYAAIHERQTGPPRSRTLNRA